ncbi:ATP-binding protein [Pseudodesulfovibrio sp.]|uniref:ATP-binding protein n=1 Tax=Pseudodesulfovibrio sp. TaxID=2035812 RepID=UPI00262932FB|nr:ATP-binding protein [Pseudodesulfovibrio sp.]MDD3310766.1 ATP-binding protein [Pseudodesulfovibrio sp.]
MPRVTFSIPSRAEAVRWACLAVRGIMEGIDLDDEGRYYVELAMSEAATNIVRHAYGNSPDQVIGLVVSVEEDRLVVEMSDTGVPLDPVRVEEASLPPWDALREDQGGRGLFLIRQLMDEVKVERRDGRNVLTLTKRHRGRK